MKKELSKLVKIVLMFSAFVSFTNKQVLAGENIRSKLINATPSIQFNYSNNYTNPFDIKFEGYHSKNKDLYKIGMPIIDSLIENFMEWNEIYKNLKNYKIKYNTDNYLKAEINPFYPKITITIDF